MVVIRPKAFEAPKSKSYLRTNAAADYVGLAVSTMAKARVEGWGPPYIKTGRIILYDRDDLDNWLASRKRTSTSDAGGVK